MVLHSKRGWIKLTPTTTTYCFVSPQAKKWGNVESDCYYVWAFFKGWWRYSKTVVMVLQVFKYTIETNVLYSILKGEFYGTWIHSITLFFLHAQGHMKKKKSKEKRSWIPPRPRESKEGGRGRTEERKQRDMHCWLVLPSSIQYTCAHTCTRMHVHTCTHTHCDNQWQATGCFMLRIKP